MAQHEMIVREVADAENIVSDGLGLVLSLELVMELSNLTLEQIKARVGEKVIYTTDDVGKITGIEFADAEGGGAVAPTDEELQVADYGYDGYAKRGPWFTACHLTHLHWEKNDGVNPFTVAHRLIGMFPDMTYDDLYEYARQAWIWKGDKLGLRGG